MIDVLGAIGLGSESGWQTRLKQGAYTSPLGLRQTFHFRELKRSTELRSTSFQFAGIDGAYVQQNGHGAREYALECVFTGPDHDLLATSFESSLLEPGVGRLEHPMYGTFDVVPTGTVERTNDTVEGANNSTVSVVFSTTLATVYPSGLSLPINELLMSIDGFDVSAASNWEKAVSFTSALDRATGKASIRKGLQAIGGSLSYVSGQVAANRREFESRNRLINEGLDVLIGQPILLAQQIIGLVLAPSRFEASLADKFAGYSVLLSRMLGLLTPSVRPGEMTRRKNEHLINDLIAGAACVALTRCLLLEKHRFRSSAMQYSALNNDALIAFMAWHDLQSATLGIDDDGTNYREIHRISTQGAGSIVANAWTLLPERAETLDRERQLIEWTAEKYKTVSDDAIQFVIDSNSLTGSEILTLPRGRRVVWYA